MRRSLIVAFGLGVLCAVALPHRPLDLHRLASAMGAAVSAPVINDVTTDVQNPPAFVKARHGAMSDSYKAAVARHYADLQPLRVPGRDAAAVLQAGRWQQPNGAAASAAAVPASITAARRNAHPAPAPPLLQPGEQRQCFRGPALCTRARRRGCWSWWMSRPSAGSETTWWSGAAQCGVFLQRFETDI